jgi:hypothetical protein
VDAGGRAAKLDDEGAPVAGRGDAVGVSVGHAGVGLVPTDTLLDAATLLAADTLLDGESIALWVLGGVESAEGEATRDWERDEEADTLPLQLGLAVPLPDGLWDREMDMLAVSDGEAETDGEALSDADEETNAEVLAETDAETDADGEGVGEGDGGGRHSNRHTLFKAKSAVMRASPPPALSGRVSMATPNGDISRALNSGTPAGSSRARVLLTSA